jgi:hypothetical protein
MPNVRHFLVVLSLSCCLCACSEGRDRPRPWVAYATYKDYNRLGRIWGGFAGGRDYLTRSDCLYDLKQVVEKDSNLRKPYGCYYWGYQNPYVLYIINWYFAKDDLLCIIRIVDAELQQITLYEPLLKGNPNQTNKYYCYLYF